MSDPIAAAQGLADALKENTKALGRVQRRNRALAAVVVLLLVLVVTMVKTRYDARVDGCHRDNELRSGLLDVADLIEGFQGDDPSSRGEAFVVSLRNDFALRAGCGDTPWL